jgi:hypothetical protein
MVPYTPGQLSSVHTCASTRSQKSDARVEVRGSNRYSVRGPSWPRARRLSVRDFRASESCTTGDRGHRRTSSNIQRHAGASRLMIIRSASAMYVICAMPLAGTPLVASGSKPLSFAISAATKLGFRRIRGSALHCASVAECSRQ